MGCLNLDIDYFDHPKTKRLVRLLGRGSEVLPIRLWVYTARYFPETGRLTGVSTQEIEDECRWWGKSDDLVKALAGVGFLHLDGKDYVVHDWTEHEGHIAVFRDRAKRAAAARWGGDATRNATSIPPSSAKRSPTSNALTNLTNQPTNSTPAGARGRAELESEARREAQCWLSAERPDLVRKFKSLASLILATGSRDKALMEARPYLSDPSIRDPFAYALSVLKGEGDAENRHVQGNGAKRKPVDRLVKDE